MCTLMSPAMSHIYSRMSEQNQVPTSRTRHEGVHTEDRSFCFRTLFWTFIMPHYTLHFTHYSHTSDTSHYCHVIGGCLLAAELRQECVPVEGVHSLHSITCLRFSGNPFCRITPNSMWFFFCPQPGELHAVIGLVTKHY